MESIAIRPGDLVEAGLFDNEDAVVSAAISDLLDHHPDLRLALAAHLYEHDEDWSIAGIAQWAGVTFWEMKDAGESRRRTTAGAGDDRGGARGGRGGATLLS